MSLAEKAAIAQLNRRFGDRIQLSGFTRTIRDELDEAEEDPESVGRFRRIPDGFFIVTEPETGLRWVVAIEVEHTHHLTRDKLADYAELWFSLDCTVTHELLLFVADRYGNLNAINLMSEWYSLHSKKPLSEEDAAYLQTEREEHAVGAVRFIDHLCTPSSAIAA